MPGCQQVPIERRGYPSIAIVIPVYNGASTIETTLRSIGNQTGVNVHATVVDHGSTDNTAARVERLSGLIPLVLIRLERMPLDSQSASRPLNAGFGLILNDASRDTDFVMRLDADDLIAADDALARILASAGAQAASDGTLPELICANLVFFDLVHKTASRFGLRPNCRQLQTLRAGAAYSIPHHSLLIAPDVLRRVHRLRSYLLDPALSYGEDLDLTLAILGVMGDAEPCFVEADLTFKRSDGPTISNSMQRWAIAKDHIRIFHKHSTLCRKLLIRAIVDLVLQKAKVRDGVVRNWLGYPGRIYGADTEVPFGFIERRLEALEDAIPCQTTSLPNH